MIHTHRTMAALASRNTGWTFTENEAALPDNTSACSANGEGRDQKNIDYWVARATANSEIAPRAKRKAVLPDTGKRMELRDTAMRQFEPRKINAKMSGD